MTEPRHRKVVWMMKVTVFLAVVFTSTSFLTTLIYRLVGYTPPQLVVQLINSLGGLLIGALLAWALFRFSARGRKASPEGVFGPIFDALRRISEGDFTVRVDTSPDHGIVGHLAESVNRMASELDELERMRQGFVSDVSHEIQSPLTSIRGFAQALKSDRLTPGERRHYLDIIESESTRLARVTEGLLKLAALESEQVNFDPQPYRLDTQIRSLILASEPQWSARSIEVDVALEEISVTADADLLSQVWTNLIQNAVKFTPAAGKISIRLLESGNQVEFRISDTGSGISNEDRPHIFERFYKSDKSRTGADSGSGLGLAIAKSIVEVHRGAIALSDENGMSTTFIVRLPVECGSRAGATSQMLRSAREQPLDLPR